MTISIYTSQKEKKFELCCDSWPLTNFTKDCSSFVGMSNNLVAKSDLQESGCKDSKIGRKRQKKFLPKFSFKVFKKSDISSRETPKKV